MDIIQWLVGTSESIDIYFLARVLVVVIAINFIGSLAGLYRR